MRVNFRTRICINICPGMYPGVISRGLRGAEPSLLKFLIVLGAQPPLKVLHWPCFSKYIALASKVFSTAMLNYALLRGY